MMSRVKAAGKQWRCGDRGGDYMDTRLLHEGKGVELNLSQ